MTSTFFHLFIGSSAALRPDINLRIIKRAAFAPVSQPLRRKGIDRAPARRITQPGYSVGDNHSGRYAVRDLQNERHFAKFIVRHDPLSFRQNQSFGIQRIHLQ